MLNRNQKITKQLKKQLLSMEPDNIKDFFNEMYEYMTDEAKEGFINQYASFVESKALEFSNIQGYGKGYEEGYDNGYDDGENSE